MNNINGIKIVCHNCQKESTVESWDNAGRRMWAGYTSLFDLISRYGNIKEGYHYICPECRHEMRSVHLKIVPATNNQEGLVFLKRDV